MLLLLCYLSCCTAMMVRMVSVMYLPPPCAIIHVCTSSATVYRRVLPSMAWRPALVLLVVVFISLLSYFSINLNSAPSAPAILLSTSIFTAYLPASMLRTFAAVIPAIWASCSCSHPWAVRIVRMLSPMALRLS